MDRVAASRMPRRQPAKSLSLGLMLGLSFSLAWGQNNVLTQHNDNMRSGQDLNETVLTPSNVNVTSFGKLFMQSVDGIIVGQPLYAGNVLMSDGNLHNVVFVATQNNSVYAFDADSIQPPLWWVSLNGGGMPDPIADYGCTETHYTQIGIMGTPVIDPTVSTLYVVAKTVTGTGANAVRNFSLHALDITSGSEQVGAPVVITGQAPSSNGGGTFNPLIEMQRPALLLQNGLLYIGFGGNGCDVYAYHGWLFAYDAQSLQQQGAFLVSPDGKQAAIWQGGSGPASDEEGYIYVATANGTYDGPVGGNDFGDSLLKMGWNANVFGVVDYFTPYNQKQLAQYDLDLGSAGPLILPDQPGLYPHELIAGGKQGTLYLINRDNEGQFDATADNVIQEIPNAVPQELTGVPAYWNNSVYVSGDADSIKQFALIDGQLSQQPVSQTTMAFANNGAASTSITSNGATNGILWAIWHSGPALFAFDPTNLATEFYSSLQAPESRDKMTPVMRFVTPTISNGKVYVGGSSALDVYGLLPVLSPAAGNNQTAGQGSILPVSLSVVAATAPAYGSHPLIGVSVTCKDNGAGGIFESGKVQTTDSTGTATFSYKLPAKPLALTISCSSTGYVDANFVETSAIGAPSRMLIDSGNYQTSYPYTLLPAPLVVKVLDVHGYAVSGVIVSFTDNGAGGSFAPDSMITASNGTASAQYTTGPNNGKVAITVSTAGLNPLSFSETVK